MASSKMVTFANQAKLGRLPLPKLKDTIDKYVESSRPFLQSRLEHIQHKLEARKFVRGLGKKLQDRLMAYECIQKHSWLEALWLEKAYLSFREPSLINVNWWCLFNDHPMHERLLLRKPPPKGVLSDFQIERASGLLTNFLNFKLMLDNQSLPADHKKGSPLCMNQYKQQFGTCRVPGSPSDTITSNSKSSHIIVMIKNQFYHMKVFDAKGERVTLLELQRQLYAIGKDCMSSTREPSIGLLTAGRRDNWANAYEILCKDATNAQNFKLIHDSILILCLDDHSTSAKLDKSHRQWFHNENAQNRFFDKTIQLIIASSGKAGVNGEHTPADAAIPGRIFEYVIQNEPAVNPNSASLTAVLEAPIKLCWNVTGDVELLINKARSVATALIKDTESVVLLFNIYGSRYIKEVGLLIYSYNNIAKTSPDSFIQMVLQLAWKRMHHVPSAVYETASTRAYLHGRTETGRTFSQESKEFVGSFDNDDILYDEKRNLFQRAIAKHSQTMSMAAQGQGIDRHLLGLNAMMEPGESVPLFDNAVFKKSTLFGISTSNMSPGIRFSGGFGPYIADGYGVNYAIQKDAIRISISTKVSGKHSDVQEFRRTVERTLIDMMVLFAKRSSVWGMDWKNDQERERKEDTYLKSMREASDTYSKKRDELMRKYEQGEEWKR